MNGKMGYTPSINMRSTATMVEGQGVGSCYKEQVRLVSDQLTQYDVRINSLKKSDVYHYHTINPNYFLEIKMNRKKSVSIGYAHFLPDTLEDSLTMPKVIKKILYKYVIAFYNSMDYLVAVNPMVVAKLKAYHVDHPQIVYIPNFVSSKDFHVQSAEKITQTREKFNLPQNKKIVLGVGQLQTRKGVIDFIDTAQRMPDTQFVWAGSFCFGKMSSGHDEIQSRMKCLPDNVTFLGIVERRDMCSLYNACDVFFLPSYDELFPMAILEALSCGKPVVVRDIEVYEEILSEYCLFGKSNADFVTLISELCMNDEVMEKWKNKAMAGSRFYSEESILKQWECMYGTALEHVLMKRGMKSDDGLLLNHQSRY